MTTFNVPLFYNQITQRFVLKKSLLYSNYLDPIQPQLKTKYKEMSEVRKMVTSCSGLKTYHWTDTPTPNTCKMRVRIHTKEGTPAKLLNDPAERIDRALQTALAGKVFAAVPTLPLEGKLTSEKTWRACK